MIEIPDSSSHVWTSHNIAGYWTQLRTQKADGFQIIFKHVLLLPNAAWLYLWQMRGSRVFHKGPLRLRRLSLLFQEEIVPTLLLFRVLEQTQRRSSESVFRFSCAKHRMCLYLDGIELVDTWSEVVRISPEGDSKQCQEAVHPCQQTLRSVQTERGGGIVMTTATGWRGEALFWALTCWLRSAWRECRRTRWLCPPGRSPWWSRVPPQTPSSWRGGCTCRHKMAAGGIEKEKSGRLSGRTNLLMTRAAINLCSESR